MLNLVLIFFFFFLYMNMYLFMYPLNFNYIYFSFYMDYMSFFLSYLSIFIIMLMLMSMKKEYFLNLNSIFCLMLMLILLFSLMMSFMFSNLFMFYLFFEFSLIPTFLIIMLWGNQPERLESSYYFFFYTIFSSLPLLILIVYSYTNSGSVMFLTLSCMKMNLFIFYFFLFSFFVKLPMFLFHLWLPKAHVEAPVSGSMILAGILLKLGGYGIYRIGMIMFKYMNMFSSFFISLGLVSMIFIGLICCRVNDLKMLVAYSSVSHMALVLCGLMSVNMWGVVGSLMMMVSHGLCSSGLFYLINVYYERFHSRSMYLLKGMMLLFSFVGLMFFFLLMGNISGPPTMNFFSEIILIMSMVSFSKFIFIMFIFGSFLGAFYSFLMYSFSSHGKITLFSLINWLIMGREYHVLLLHIYPMMFLFIMGNFFI